MSAYETDPAWLAARAETYSETRTDETPFEGYQRRVAATYRMYEIETAAEAQA